VGECLLTLFRLIQIIYFFAGVYANRFDHISHWYRATLCSDIVHKQEKD
jgi:hypothetical protein